MRGRDNERGAALLTVLLIVAVMAVISATALDRLTLSVRVAGNAARMDQARAFTLAAEALAVRRIDALVRRDAAQLSLAGDWMGRDFVLPLPGGSAVAQVYDGGNCFNLNSLGAETSGKGWTTRPLAVAQLARLLESLGISLSEAQPIAAAAADWIDSDSISAASGSEDSVYRGRAPSMLPANRPMADASEFSVVAGVTPRIYNLAKPWLCALPVSEMSAVNVNTLRPQQAPLLAMLMPAQAGSGPVLPAQLRVVLAQRPADGYGSVYRFWQQPALRGLSPPPDAADQVRVTTRWFRLVTSVRMGDDGDSEIGATTMIDAGDSGTSAGPRVVQRMWGEDGL